MNNRDKQLKINKTLRKYQIPKTCKNCGKDFTSKDPLKFCNRKCYFEFKMAGKPSKKEIKCMNCGITKEIPMAHWKIHPDHKKFCSEPCMREYKLKQSITHCKCQKCGKEFDSRPRSFTKYCSMKCYSEGMSERYSDGRYAGENHPSWLGGMGSWRGENWSKIKRKVWKRDNWVCQACGAIDRLLHAHHIVPWRISKNNSMENLISLCIVCHPIEENRFRRTGITNYTLYPKCKGSGKIIDYPDGVDVVVI